MLAFGNVMRARTRLLVSGKTGKELRHLCKRHRSPDRSQGDGCRRWILLDKRYLTHDLDPLFTAEFLILLTGIGVESVKWPPRPPNLNSHAERFVRSMKVSCLDHLILFGEESLRTAVSQFVAHYHRERPHQGVGNRLLRPEPSHVGSTGAIQRHQRLGGLLNYYYREAA